MNLLVHILSSFSFCKLEIEYDFMFKELNTCSSDNDM